jgi:hypothetical protein
LTPFMSSETSATSGSSEGSPAGRRGVTVADTALP